MGRQTIEFAPVGNSQNNGFDLGGARIYPISNSLAVTPPSMYSQYIGTGDSIPVAPPVAAQAGSTGVSGSSNIARAVSQPFGKYSPLLWIIAGLFGAVAAMHAIHYK